MRSTRIVTAPALPWFRTLSATSVPQVGAFAFGSFQARQLSLKASFLKALRDNPAVPRLKCVDSTASLTSFRAERSNAHQDPCPAAVPTQHACDSPQQSALALAPSGRETLEVFHTPSASHPDSSWGFHTLFQSQAFVGT